MAMSQNSLKARIEANIKVEFGDPEEADKLAKFANAIAKSIYDEITENADLVLLAGDIPVPAVGILDSTSGVCTGAAASSSITLSTRIK